MTKYLIRRIVHGLVSIIIVVAIVMILIYSCLDRQLIFAQDPVYTQLGNNQKTVYQYRKWEDYGYIDYVTYPEWLQSVSETEGRLDAKMSKKKVAPGGQQQLFAYKSKPLLGGSGGI